MRISSTKISSVAGSKSFKLPATPQEGVDNTKKDTVFLSNRKEAVLGAAVGGTVLGGSLLTLAGPVWGAAGAAIGAAAGLAVGSQWPQLSYDAKNVLNYAGRRLQSNSLNKQAQKESQPQLAPLGPQFRLKNDSVGDVKKLYDGYDSSRNLTGLLAQEGKPEEPYRIGIEHANLRPGAEKVALAGTLTVGTGEQKIRLELGNDERAKVRFSPRFNQTVVELDKDALRRVGWKDQEALSLSVETRDHDGVVSDTLQASTTDKVKEKLFRWEGKTIYQIVTDRFANGDNGNDQWSEPSDPQRFHGGDWQGVIERLDYLDNLGVDCIWLSCPYKNDRDFFGQDGYHGYWPNDFSAAEPSFGDKPKLKELVDKAHQRGMKVMLDVVVNHTGYNHPVVRDANYSEWFHKEGARNPLSQYYLENGSLAGLPDLAHENTDVSRYLIDVHKSWQTDTGVDAFRMDAVRHVPGTFLREFDRAVDETDENFMTMGEVFWNDPHYLAGYQNETQDSLFDFPLMQALRDVFGGNPEQSLKERLTQFQETKKHNFGQAVIDLTNTGGSSMKKLSKVLSTDHAYDNPRMLSTILDNHDTGRFLSQAGGDKEKLKIATGFLFACRGTPSLYYGTESGMEGQLGANREDMQFDGDAALKDHVRNLIQIRKNSEPLQIGTQSELFVDDTAYAFTRVLPQHEVVCAFNNSDEERTISIPLSDTQIEEGARLQSLTGEESYGVKDRRVDVTLPAKGFCFLDWSADR